MILTFMKGDVVLDDGSAAGDQKQDVMVKPEQRIGDVYEWLWGNENPLPVRYARQLRVYSVRQRTYVNPLLTFRQGEIYAGDILIIYG